MKKIEIQNNFIKWLETNNEKYFNLFYKDTYKLFKEFLFFQFRGKLTLENINDIISNTFYKIILNKNNYDKNKATFLAWAYKILKNECLLFLKSSKKVVKLKTDDDENDELIEKLKFNKLNYNYVNFDYELFENIEREAIKILFKTINEFKNKKQKEILIERFLNGLKYIEIKNKLNYNIQDVKNNIRLGRIKINKILKNNETIKNYLELLKIKDEQYE